MAEFEGWKQEIDFMLRNVAVPHTQFRLSESYWQPNVDVLETEENLIVTIDLAGILEENLQLTLESQSLKIEGERQSQTTKELRRVYIMEIPQGRFERELYLPCRVDTEHTQAVLSNGLLRIVLRKEREAQEEKEQISVAIRWEE